MKVSDNNYYPASYKYIEKAVLPVILPPRDVSSRIIIDNICKKRAAKPKVQNDTYYSQLTSGLHIVVVNNQQ